MFFTEELRKLGSKYLMYSQCFTLFLLFLSLNVTFYAKNEENSEKK